MVKLMLIKIESLGVVCLCKSDDDIFWCIGGPKGVSIQFLGDDGNTKKDLNIDLNFKDFTERCDSNTGTTLFDEDSRKRTRFR